MLDMYRRKAVNSKKESFTLPCEYCDCTFPTFTGFYLGVILGLEQKTCQCGDGAAYNLPISKIKELYELSKEMALKDDSTASKSMLMSLFGKIDLTKRDDGPINLDIDLDMILAATKLQTNTLVISGRSADAPGKQIKTPSTTHKFTHTTTMETSQEEQAGQPIELLSKNKKQKTSNGGNIKVGDRTIKSNFISDSTHRATIHGPNHFAEKVGVSSNNSSKMAIIKRIWNEEIDGITTYTPDVYDAIIGRIRKKLSE